MKFCRNVILTLLGRCTTCSHSHSLHRVYVCSNSNTQVSALPRLANVLTVTMYRKIVALAAIDFPCTCLVCCRFLVCKSKRLGYLVDVRSLVAWSRSENLRTAVADSKVQLYNLCVDLGQVSDVHHGTLFPCFAFLRQWERRLCVILSSLRYGHITWAYLQQTSAVQRVGANRRPSWFCRALPPPSRWVLVGGSNPPLCVHILSATLAAQLKRPERIHLPVQMACLG